jgi:8-oxo-dGTP pyrophosphatase MutT (NUDIX family)
MKPPTPRSNHVKKCICCACVLSQDGSQVLLVKQRKTQKWSFPKGSKTSTESKFKCMLRELYEETGLKLQDLHPFCLFRVTRKKHVIYVIRLQEKVLPTNLIVQDIHEIETCGWIPLHALPYYKYNKITQKILIDLFKTMEVVGD